MTVLSAPARSKNKNGNNDNK